MTPNPGTIAVYLVTDRNFDGSPATCGDGSPIDVFSYTVNIHSFGASVAFSNIVSHFSGTPQPLSAVTNAYSLSVAYSGFLTLPPGKHKLFSFDAAFGNESCPGLTIGDHSCFLPSGVITSFGSSCSGSQMDNTLALGQDWSGTGDVVGCTDMTGRAPSLTCPDALTGKEGRTLTFVVYVFDPDCEIHSFYNYGLPPGAMMSPLSGIVQGRAYSTFSWTPAPGQAGEYSIRFVTSEPDYFMGRDRGEERIVRLTILPGNTAPTALAGGPYAGVERDPVRFDGSHSHDPEGDPLEYAWTFGDGSSASGEAPRHTYANHGLYPVALTVTDPGGLSDVDSTTATIARDITVRAFATAANGPTRLPNGKPTTCFQIEALPDVPFSPEEIVPGTVALRYTDPGCGEMDVYTSAVKWPVLGDTDHNGTPEYEACFSREAMRTLGTCFLPGSHTVPIMVYGRLADGSRFRGELTHTFVVAGGNLAASISPNPLDRSSAVAFTTERTGSATARLYDIRGRLVATLFERPSLEPGSHRVPLQAIEGVRDRLASGVYFVRIATEHDGSETRRVTILR
jgi:PKD repeat protein